MAATIKQNINLAQTLHPRLLRLFTRFPPPQLAAKAPRSPPQAIEIAETTSPTDPNASISTELPTSPPALEWASNESRKHNPFLPFKNPRTGNWHPPHYSLRRQAELFKLAKAQHVLPLMPTSPKHPQVREQKRLDRALRAAKTGLLPISGKKAKGRLWERTLRVRLEDRRKAMEAMPEMIKRWKETGRGKGWKKWPK